MTLEKEMIRLFDAGGREKKEDETNLSHEKSCYSRLINASPTNESYVAKALNFNKPHKRNNEQALDYNVGNKVKIRTRLRNKYLWPSIDCLTILELIVLSCFIFVTLPQLLWSLPLPNPQLVVRSQSLLFSNQQYGRQIDLSHKTPSNEVFWLNFEEGYFACQVNASEKFLKLFRLSRLCDGFDDCYKGTDELVDTIKCSQACQPDSSCSSHGVCLDVSAELNNKPKEDSIIWRNDDGSLATSISTPHCVCDDGYGGKDCSVEDVNECKFRPCSPFADCTNTLGGYKCNCRKGYHGDGHTCDVSSDNIIDDSHKVITGISNSHIDTPTFGVASSWVPFNESQFGIASSYIPFNESSSHPSVPKDYTPKPRITDTISVKSPSDTVGDKPPEDTFVNESIVTESSTVTGDETTKSTVQNNIFSARTTSSTTFKPPLSSSSSSPLDKISNVKTDIHSETTEENLPVVDVISTTTSRFSMGEDGTLDEKSTINPNPTTSVILPVIPRENNNDTLIDITNYTDNENGTIDAEKETNDIRDDGDEQGVELQEYDEYYGDDRSANYDYVVPDFPEYDLNESLYPDVALLSTERSFTSSTNEINEDEESNSTVVTVIQDANVELEEPVEKDGSEDNLNSPNTRSSTKLTSDLESDSSTKDTTSNGKSDDEDDDLLDFSITTLKSISSSNTYDKDTDSFASTPTSAIYEDVTAYFTTSIGSGEDDDVDSMTKPSTILENSEDVNSIDEDNRIGSTKSSTTTTDILTNIISNSTPSPGVDLMLPDATEKNSESKDKSAPHSVIDDIENSNVEVDGTKLATSTQQVVIMEDESSLIYSDPRLNQIDIDSMDKTATDKNEFSSIEESSTKGEITTVSGIEKDADTTFSESSLEENTMGMKDAKSTSIFSVVTTVKNDNADENSIQSTQSSFEYPQMEVSMDSIGTEVDHNVEDDTKGKFTENINSNVNDDLGLTTEETLEKFDLSKTPRISENEINLDDALDDSSSTKSSVDLNTFKDITDISGPSFDNNGDDGSSLMEKSSLSTTSTDDIQSSDSNASSIIYPEMDSSTTSYGTQNVEPSSSSMIYPDMVSSVSNPSTITSEIVEKENDQESSTSSIPTEDISAVQKFQEARLKDFLNQQDNDNNVIEENEEATLSPEDIISILYDPPVENTTHVQLPIQTSNSGYTTESLQIDDYGLNTTPSSYNEYDEKTGNILETGDGKLKPDPEISKDDKRENISQSTTVIEINTPAGAKTSDVLNEVNALNQENLVEPEDTVEQTTSAKDQQSESNFFTSATTEVSLLSSQPTSTSKSTKIDVANKKANIVEDDSESVESEKEEGEDKNITIEDKIIQTDIAPTIIDNVISKNTIDSEKEDILDENVSELSTVSYAPITPIGSSSTPNLSSSDIANPTSTSKANTFIAEETTSKVVIVESTTSMVSGSKDNKSDQQDTKNVEDRQSPSEPVIISKIENEEKIQPITENSTPEQTIDREEVDISGEEVSMISVTSSSTERHGVKKTTLASVSTSSMSSANDILSDDINLDLARTGDILVDTPIIVPSTSTMSPSSTSMVDEQTKTSTKIPIVTSNDKENIIDEILDILEESNKPDTSTVSPNLNEEMANDEFSTSKDFLRTVSTTRTTDDSFSKMTEKPTSKTIISTEVSSTTIDTASEIGQFDTPLPELTTSTAKEITAAKNMVENKDSSTTDFSFTLPESSGNDQFDNDSSKTIDTDNIDDEINKIQIDDLEDSDKFNTDRNKFDNEKVSIGTETPGSSGSSNATPFNPMILNDRQITKETTTMNTAVSSTTISAISELIVLYCEGVSTFWSR